MAAGVALGGLSLIKMGASVVASFWPLQGPLVSSSVRLSQLICLLSFCLVFSLCPHCAPPLLSSAHQAAYLSFLALLWRQQGVWESTGYLEPAGPGFKSWL